MAVRRQRDEGNRALQNVPMTEEAFARLISEESSYRYELIDGLLYDMTGSSPRHSAIASRMDLLLQEQLGWSGPCRTHREQYVAIPERPPVVPDLVLTCDRADWDEDKHSRPFKIRFPLLVVEVLSPATEKYNRGEKFERYKRCLTLQIYMLVSQQERSVEVYRRPQNWQKEHFTSRQIIRLEPLELKLPLNLIYRGILED